MSPGDRPHLLRRTLESARNQRTPLLEILVVCLDADARAVAQAVAGDDTRVRILAARSVADGRRLGVRRARGGQVVLATAGDSYLPGAVQSALDAADGRAPVLLAAAGDPAGHADLAGSPELAGALRLGRVVWSQVPAAALADPDPDGAAAAVRALRGGCRVTDRTAYADVRASSPAPHSVRLDPLPGLPARIGSDEAVLAELPDLPAARAHAAAGAVGALRPYLEAAETADAPTWTALSSHAADLLQAAAECRDRVDVVPRAMALLAAAGRRQDLL
ncbi:MAG: glycosyltransferase family A protein, partial [Actinomycetes bacterium]